MTYFEVGFYNRLYEDLSGRFIHVIEKVYTDVERLKNDYIKTQLIDLNYFSNLFIYFVVLDSLLLLLFALDHCTRYLLKRRRLIQNYLNEFRIELQSKFKMMLVRTGHLIRCLAGCTVYKLKNLFL